MFLAKAESERLGLLSLLSAPFPPVVSQVRFPDVVNRSLLQQVHALKHVLPCCLHNSSHHLLVVEDLKDISTFSFHGSCALRWGNVFFVRFLTAVDRFKRIAMLV